MAQYDELAGWYDALYGAAGKDHADEADALLAFATDAGVEVMSLLDVGCGTGLHLEAFAHEVEDLVGVDNAPAMLELARARLDGSAVLRHGDMRRFDLGRTFDVVTCLFSAIGHVRDESDLDAAVAAMATHVAPGGMLLVEPWLTPDGVRPGGMRDLTTVETDDGVCARASRSERRGDVMVLDFAWAVATREGTATHEETFRMPLFSRERYLAAVRAAGLEASWVDLDALVARRGLLVGARED